MLTSAISSLEICPINFKEFNIINKQLNNIEASLLYSKLKFHEANSKLKKSGKTWIARSRDQISAWFGFSLKKVDRLLSFLTTKGMIEKRVGLWYGKKRLFITTSAEFNQIPINLKIIEVLIDQIGSIKSALLFSRIAYSFAKSQIIHGGLQWCCLKKEILSTWSGISIRTIDRILESFIKKGLILKKNFIWREKLQTHFHIPDFVIESLKSRFQEFKKLPLKTSSKSKDLLPAQKENTFQLGINNNVSNEGNKLQNSPVIVDLNTSCTNGQICRQHPAKMTNSIKIRSNLKETNNITSQQISTDSTKTDKTSKTGDIIFNEIKEVLITRQMRYLQSALHNTIQRKKLKISCPQELLEEIKFSILNSQQHKHIKNFQHVVSRCMKILADGNWRTPIGFHKFSVYGKEIKKLRERQLDNWRSQKENDYNSVRQFYPEPAQTGNFYQFQNKNKIYLTKKAMEIAEKIVGLVKGNGNSGDVCGASRFTENLTKELERLIRLGADKTQVVIYLRENCSE